MNEKQLQRSVVEALQWQGLLVFEFAKPGTHGRLKGSVPSNWPDVLAIDRMGQHFYFEVKRPGKEATDLQAKFHQELRYWGCYVAVAHSPEEVLEALRGWGMKLRVRLT